MEWASDTPSIAGASGDAPARVGQLGDELLARLVGRGSARAFAVVYERYHRQLYRYCHSIVRDEADAQDALQTTFARALAALQEGKRSAPLRPWLFRIAHNESVSLLRRRPAACDPSVVEDAGWAPSAADSAEERARLAQLVADLGELGERARSALVLRELSGLSHEEIGAVLGMSAGAAKQAIFEARTSLQELAEGRAMECAEVTRRLSDADGRVLRGRRIRAHLRDCVRCSDFAAAIPARRADLKAISPVLGPAAAAGLLSRAVAGGGSVGGGSGGAVGGGSGGAVASGVAGKAVGGVVASKAVVGVVAIAAVAGAGGLHAALSHHPQAPARAPVRAPGPAFTRSAAPAFALAPAKALAPLVAVEKATHRAVPALRSAAAAVRRRDSGAHAATSAHAGHHRRASGATGTSTGSAAHGKSHAQNHGASATARTSDPSSGGGGISASGASHRSANATRHSSRGSSSQAPGRVRRS